MAALFTRFLIDMMHKLKQVIAIVGAAVMLGTAGCSTVKELLPSNIYQLPYKAPPNAPQEYKLGWEHGCKSGLAAYGNDFYKTFYKFTQDLKLIRNPVYYKAWSDSFHYCRAYVNRLLAGYSFRGVPEGEVDPIFDPKTITIRPVYDQRNESNTKGYDSLKVPLFEGLELPGWNENGWGSDVACQSDWLGRQRHLNWLGQAESDEDCSYVGSEDKD